MEGNLKGAVRRAGELLQQIEPGKNQHHAQNIASMGDHSPLVMALADMRAEMVTGLQRFRNLFRLNELQPDTIEEGKTLLRWNGAIRARSALLPDQ